VQTANNKEIAKFLKGYKHIAEMSDEAMFIHDVKGTIFDVNKVAEDLTGYTRQELLKMNVRQMVTRDEQKVSEKALNLVNTLGVEVDFESRFKRKDGSTIDVRIIEDKFKFKRYFFVIGLVTDITSYRKFAKKNPHIDAIQDKKFIKFLMPLGKVYTEPMRVLIEVAESRDPYTMEHSMKVTNYATELARIAGLPKKEVEIIRLAAMFHDIGKIGIRAQILMKTSCLSKTEYDEVKKHPLLSVEIVKSIQPVKGIIPIIKHHHENYGGNGYPDGIKGKQIPLGARILAIADVYDALTSERAYRKAYSYQGALKLMEDMREKKFDPELLDHFLKYLSQEKAKER
jgi:PAS domain S-box-containing protein/putative nucleotidyltransferase with HDIG domain